MDWLIDWSIVILFKDGQISSAYVELYLPRSFDFRSKIQRAGSEDSILLARCKLVIQSERYKACVTRALCSSTYLSGVFSACYVIYCENVWPALDKEFLNICITCSQMALQKIIFS
jgi:hypothetical protein